MAAIELHAVSGAERAGWALRDVSLRVDDGEVLALVGPSGAGKTTLLRLVAGFEDPASGVLRIGERTMEGVASAERDLAMVLQHGGLLPHLNVRRNIAFPLRLRRHARREAEDRAELEARVFGIRELLDRTPNTLSSGERQLTAVARMTIRQPGAYLMDEPLATLDPRERDRVRAELTRFLRGAGVTTLYATNDQREALALADRIAVLRDGRLVEVGTTDALYATPGSAFTAGFLGEPGMNLFPAQLEAGNRSAFVRCDSGSLELLALPPPLRDVWDGKAVLAGVRPEDLRLTPEGEGLTATVSAVEHLGSSTLAHMELIGADGSPVVARLPREDAPAPGSSVRLTASPRALHLFDPHAETALWHGTEAPHRP